MCAQNKFQCVSHEVLPELISTFIAFVHFDSELPKVPFLNGLLRVRCAIRTFRQNSSPLRALSGIHNIYYYNEILSANLTCRLLNMSYRFTLPAPPHLGHRFLESPTPIVPSPWHSGHVTNQSSSRS